MRVAQLEPVSDREGAPWLAWGELTESRWPCVSDAPCGGGVMMSGGHAVKEKQALPGDTLLRPQLGDPWSGLALQAACRGGS